MSFFSSQPVLAVLFNEWTCVAVIVMMLVGWITNLIKNSKNRPAPAARRQGRGPQQRGDDRLQSEIDSFLQEVGGGKRRDEPEELAIEIVPEEEQRRRRRRPQSLPPQGESQQVLTSNVPLSERHLESSIGSSGLGSELREHVTEYMHDDHIEAQVEQDLSGGSDWTKRGGTLKSESERNRADSPSGPGRQTTAGGIVGLLRNPATVRQAILISEILSRPASRRK